MTAQNNKIFLSIILILAVAGAVFVFPKQVNNFLDFAHFGFMQKIPETSFKLGLDLQGGSHLVYQADLINIPETERAEAMAGLRDVIERRVNVFGVSEPQVAVQEAGGNFRLIVDLPGIDNTQEAIKMIGKTPFLEFKEQRADEERDAILEKQKNSASSTQANQEDPYFKQTNLTGQYLKKASLWLGQNGMTPEVSLEFDEQGARIFEELTQKNIGKQIAIYIDNILISAPRMQEAISGGKAQITGDFTIEQAKELARNLNSGALPVPIALISQSAIGPSLGHFSLNQSLKAGLYGFLAICLFLIIVYRLPGFFSCLALIAYILFSLSLFKIFNITLSLSGIAGALLSMGMAVDANILIFSRSREELKTGKNYTQAFSDGAKRAWPSIRDGNFTTILVAFILFFLGSGFIKGFALTMILGNLLGMFCAILVANNILKLFNVRKVSWLWV